MVLINKFSFIHLCNLLFNFLGFHESGCVGISLALVLEIAFWRDYCCIRVAPADTIGKHSCHTQLVPTLLLC